MAELEKRTHEAGMQERASVPQSVITLGHEPDELYWLIAAAAKAAGVEIDSAHAVVQVGRCSTGTAPGCVCARARARA